MSGGSWDYFYLKCEDVASNLCCEKSPVRRAFGEHMKLIAKAMHDIEWVDSSDMGLGDDIPAIKAVFEDVADEKELKVLLKDARDLIGELSKYTESN